MALKNIIIKIEKGSKVGIVGRTGTGKSPLINCLLKVNSFLKLKRFKSFLLK